ncbi:MAG: hypothetical protein HZA24_09385 [Nitrospirae bacterium]|nr:hypothetical protein [Nitrospirota bacterium]
MNTTTRALAGLVLLALLAVPVSLAAESPFCAGFEKGYVAGYKKASGSPLAPLVPPCPLQPLKGPGDPRDDAEHGYLIGLEEGMADGR